MSSTENASRMPDRHVAPGDKSLSEGSSRDGSSSYDADELGHYRSLCTLAVVALVLGICSVLAFASPLMLIVPLSAAATALLAMRSISASAGGLSGLRLAQLGLALAVFFAVASIVRIEARSWMLKRQAEQVGRQWLSLAAERRAEDMLEYMTKPAIDKVSPTDSQKQPLSFFGGMLSAALLRNDPLVTRLSELAGGDQLPLRVEEADVAVAGNMPQAGFRFSVGDVEARQDCVVALKRFKAPGDKTVWLVDTWKLEASR